MNSETTQEPIQEPEAPKHITDIEIGQYVRDELTGNVLKFEGIEMHENVFVGKDIRLTIPNHELPNFENRLTFIDPPEEKKEDTATNSLEDIQPSPEPSPEL